MIVWAKIYPALSTVVGFSQLSVTNGKSENMEIPNNQSCKNSGHLQIMWEEALNEDGRHPTKRGTQHQIMSQFNEGVRIC